MRTRYRPGISDAAQMPEHDCTSGKFADKPVGRRRSIPVCAQQIDVAGDRVSVTGDQFSPRFLCGIHDLQELRIDSMQARIERTDNVGFNTNFQSRVRCSWAVRITANETEEHHEFN